METGEKYTFSIWKYNHYFEFVSTKDHYCTSEFSVHSVLVVTKLYLPPNTLSNFKEHLESKHGTVKPVKNAKQKATPATHA